VSTPLRWSVPSRRCRMPHQPRISDDSNTSAGNLDGGGFSYSAQALAAAG